METEKQASLEKNQQTDSQAFPLHKNAETKDSQNGDDREMRIIIIGASKSGKSTAKDVLLGEECIKQRAPASQSSSTTTTAEMAEVEKGDMYLKVLDTPDIGCPELRDEKKAKEEIKKWKVMCPDPHLILLAIRCDTRDLVSDVSKFQRFRMLWGDNLRRRFSVLFTFGDKLQESVDEFLSRSHSALQDVMDCAGHHYIIFNSLLSTSEQKGRAQQVFQIVKDFRNVFNVLIIGKTGNGKSSIGNSLLRTPAFSVSRGMSSFTKHTVTQSAQINDMIVKVTDTPDVSNISTDEKAAGEEIKKWCYFHPDAVLLAIRYDIRYTPEEYQIYQQIKKALGEQYLRSRLTVAFTFGDRQDKDINEELKTVCTELKDILKDADHRCIMFSNKAQKVSEHNKKDPLTQLMNCALSHDSFYSFPEDPCENTPTQLQSCRAADVETQPMPARNIRQLKVLIIGKTGNGKSSLGNILLNNTSAFRVSRGLNSSTTFAVTNSAEVHGVTVTVMDTPDISNLGVDEKAAEEEIKKWCFFHPDFILLAIRCDVRYTAEEHQIYQQIKKVLGEEHLTSKLTIAFTFGDRQDKDINEELKTVCPELKDVLKDADNRYIMFSNKAQKVSEHNKKDPLTQLMNCALSHAERMRGCEVDSSLSAGDQLHADVTKLKDPCENTPTQLQSCRAADVETQPMPARNTRQLKVLIIGKTGNGKSSLGNILLNNTSAFRVSRGLNSSTTFAVTNSAEVHGVTVTVMDTPDISNLGVDEKAAEEEIKKWCSFHPDFILLAIRCDVRYTAEEHQIYQQIKKVLGEEHLTSKLTIAFTFGDRQDKDINEELKTVCPELKDVLKDADNRYIMFSNKAQKVSEHNKKDPLTQLMNCALSHESQDPVAVKKRRKECDAADSDDVLAHPVMPVSCNGADTNAALHQCEEIRIIIIGASGSGKSTAANVLIGEDMFQMYSINNPVSPATCQLKQTQSQHPRMKVLDTPDLDCQELKNEKKAKEEIQKWKAMCPNPHLILLAIRCDTRDLVSDVLRFQRFVELWEDNLKRRLVVLFTFGDRLKKSIEEFMVSSSSALHQVMDCAGHRYVIFDRSLSASEQRDRADQVFNIVNELKNGFHVMIIGKTGNGKSTVGNSLLDTAAFRVTRGLATSTTQTVTASAQKDGLTITVADTPDVSNLGVERITAEQEIKKWYLFHPDIILLAVRCDVRYTAEEHQIYQQIKKVLGEDYLRSRLIVAFTFGDRQDRDINEELKTVCTELKNVLKDAGQRYILFNKEDKADKRHEHFMRLKKFVFDDEIPSEGNTRRPKRAQESDRKATTGKEAKLPIKGASETVHNIQLQLPGRVSRMEPYKDVKSSERFSAFHCELL
ncbi:uncharacterized protein LOC112573901 isoform X4 [Pomacea canaliculata]|uniref:uncharacterized protein LOC112573901 isoform X4 n=1 Tax=Pomacea canaliculata TaxID=400727 RepID=UPI000D72C437|nr:uncharacterized protein LOC112573901 isoform X4 [Pomacea canaliculata]